MDTKRFFMPSMTSLVAIGVVLFLYQCYRWALPKPIKGIPYHKKSAKSILGDVPSLMKHVGETKASLTWMSAQCIELNSPIVQLFLKPLGKPVVLLSDFRETQDITMRRLKDFDRSDLFYNVFVGILPNHHIIMPSNEKQKNHRRMLGDTMTPTFLNDIASPLIYDVLQDMIALWRLKLKLARGHPFEASTDIIHAALDAIWVATFAVPIKTVASQVSLLSTLSSLPGLSSNIDDVAVIPRAPTPAAFNSVMEITESTAPLLASPVPRLQHWFIRQFPFYKKATAYKEQLLTEHMDAAREKFATAVEQEGPIKSGIDHMFQREVAMAKKEGREPDFDTRAARDELFGFLIAGHETTSTTLAWGLKLLTDNPTITDTLRSTLYTALSTPSSPSSPTSTAAPMPSATAIAKAHIPYLDAVLEEILRLGGTAGALSRVTLHDTTVLGHVIPKGTDIYCLSNGPSFLSPAMHIEEKDRSESSRKAEEGAMGGRGTWETEGMADFKPERWLVRDEKGQMSFDGRAGPNAQFGFGPRGCFGKRLAYLEMRLVIVMVLWNFRLLKCPEGLSTYAAEDKLTHHPQHCYVRLEEV